MRRVAKVIPTPDSSSSRQVGTQKDGRVSTFWNHRNRCDLGLATDQQKVGVGKCYPFDDRTWEFFEKTGRKRIP